MLHTIHRIGTIQGTVPGSSPWLISGGFPLWSFPSNLQEFEGDSLGISQRYRLSTTTTSQDVGDLYAPPWINIICGVWSVNNGLEEFSLWWRKPICKPLAPPKKNTPFMYSAALEQHPKDKWDKNKLVAEWWGDKGTSRYPKHIGSSYISWWCVCWQKQQISERCRTILSAQIQPNALKLIGLCFIAQLDNVQRHTAKEAQDIK